MTEKCYLLFGTKIYNYTTKDIGLIICTWVNEYYDGVWILQPVLIKKENVTTLLLKILKSLMRMMMKIKNKLTKEVLELSYNDFKEKFSKEIKQAYESFRKTEVSKNYYKPVCEAHIESDFYFELQWDFADCRQRAEVSSFAAACPFIADNQEIIMEIQTGILKNFSIASAPRKNQKENLEVKSLKNGEKSHRKILLKNKHSKNRPHRAVFQFCIFTDSQFVDLKTE